MERAPITAKVRCLRVMQVSITSERQSKQGQFRYIHGSSDHLITAGSCSSLCRLDKAASPATTTANLRALQT